MTSSAKTLDLACATEERYALPLAVMLHTAGLHLHRETHLRVWVIDGGVAPRLKARLQRSLHLGNPQAELHWLQPVGGAYAAIPAKGHLSRECFYRLMLPELLPSLDKLLYLDCDVMVQSDLTELWQQFEASEPVAVKAVQGYGAPYASSERGIPHFERYGIAGDNPFFNSGVMCMNLRLWRELHIAERALELATGPTYGDLIDMDQTALNILLHDRWQRLHPSWNVMHPIYHWDQWRESAHKHEIGPLVDELISRPRILHFTGASKPWLRNSNHPKAAQFLEQLDRSGWLGHPIQRFWWYQTRT
jgi:lipopolysaccharide biosynthesis glycosyltransferase